MKKVQIYKTVTVILLMFVAALLLPLAFISWKGGDYSGEENRLLAGMPDVFTDEGRINPQLPTEFESWFEDHIGFRSMFVKLTGDVKYHLFRQSPSELVHIGKDGWFFYTGDDNLKIATGDYPLSRETLAQILAEHLAIRDKLAARGIEYVVVLPTSKVSIYPEYLRCGDGQVRQTPVDVVADYLEENSDLRVVRLKQALLDAKQNSQVYFKTDTHWNQAGAYVAYQQIISKMDQWGLCKEVPLEVRFEDSTRIGEFGNMMGIELPAEPTENLVILDQHAVKNEPSDRYTAFCEAVADEEIMDECNYYHNPSSDGPKMMMFGDSMFGADWHARELLAENFSEFSYIWDRDIRTSLLDAMEPDIVVYELTERYLNTMPNFNAALIQTELTEPDAQILDSQWDGDTLTVTVRNTGSEPWKWTDQIKLGLISGGRDSNLRALLPADVQVGPGEEYTFSLDLAGQKELLDAGPELTMLQEGIVYFGERAPVEPAAAR